MILNYRAWDDILSNYIPRCIIFDIDEYMSIQEYCSVNWFNFAGDRHRKMHPALIVHRDNIISLKQWYNHGKKYRIGNLPCFVTYYVTGNVSHEWWANHKPMWNIPCHTLYYENGQIKIESLCSIQSGHVHEKKLLFIAPL